jgi:ketosteroid isomerase-like protein
MFVIKVLHVLTKNLEIMKKTFLTSVLAIIVALFTTSIGFAQSNEQYKAQIEKINKEMVKAMVSGNADESMSFYTDDAISLPNYDKMLEGKDALRKSNEAMTKAGWKVTSFEPVTLKVMSCDKTITEIGTYKIIFSMDGMPNPVQDTGKYVTIWEKQSDNSLKIKVETWNTDTFPMEKKM